VLTQAGTGAGDRVLLTLPLAWAVAADAYLALLETGALTLADAQTGLAELFEFAPTVLICTPSDAIRLAQAAASQHQDLVDSSVRLVVLTAEPGGSLDVTRQLIEHRWGAACLDVYAVTELGVLGWSCGQRRDGIHLHADAGELNPQVIEPQTGQVVGEGQVGELVVARSSSESLRTGDLVRAKRGNCDCGDGAPWLEGGILGRIDECVDVRGRLILPSFVEQVVRRHPAVIDFSLRAYAVNDSSEVAVELEATDAISSEGDRARVAAEVAEDLKRSLGLRLQCDVLPPRPLPLERALGRRAQRLTRQ
jgi:phenylacetate-CoA ligase